MKMSRQERKEIFHTMIGAWMAGLVIALVFSVVLVLFILLCVLVL